MLFGGFIAKRASVEKMGLAVNDLPLNHRVNLLMLIADAEF